MYKPTILKVEMLRHFYLWHFDTSLNYLDLWRSQVCKKMKSSTPVMSKSSPLILLQSLHVDETSWFSDFCTYFISSS